MRPDAVLCLLLDGSTSAPTSGDLARQIIRDVVDWYVATDEAAMAESLSRQLRRTHRSLSGRFPRDSVSYVLAHVVNQCLRLASVSPALLEVYADEGMSLKQLMAFAVTADHGRQEQVWQTISGSW